MRIPISMLWTPHGLSIGLIGVATVVGVFVRPFVFSPWFSLFAVPVLLFGAARLSTGKTGWKSQLSLGLAVVSIVAASFHIGNVITNNIRHPYEWDFLTFWLDGNVAVNGLNLYNPSSYEMIELPIVPSDGFTREILEVGFRYPPPTMFLFAPLGLFDISTALTYWYSFHIVILVFSAILIWRVFFPKSGVSGFFVSSALLALMYPTMQTFVFAQTNFLVLLCFLLFWWTNKKFEGGVFLAVGILTKPILLILCIYIFIRRLWKPLFGLILIGCISSLFSMVVFGFDSFLDYFSDPPSGRMPQHVFSEGINQSLLATILKVRMRAPAFATALFSKYTFISISLLLTSITAFLTIKLDGRDRDLTLALTLGLALLVYPGTLAHYGVLLIVPLLWLWRERRHLEVGESTVVGFITCLYVIMALEHGPRVFLAVALAWSALAAIGIRWMLMKKGASPNPTTYPNLE